MLAVALVPWRRTLLLTAMLMLMRNARGRVVKSTYCRIKVTEVGKHLRKLEALHNGYRGLKFVGCCRVGVPDDGETVRTVSAAQSGSRWRA